VRLDQAINTWGPVNTWYNLIQSMFLVSVSPSDLTYKTTIYIISISASSSVFCLLPKPTRNAIVLLTRYLFSSEEERANWEIYSPNMKFDSMEIEKIIHHGEFLHSEYAVKKILGHMRKLNKKTYDSLIENIINGQIAYDVIKS
jgi:hypothetical protein